VEVLGGAPSAGAANAGAAPGGAGPLTAARRTAVGERRSPSSAAPERSASTADVATLVAVVGALFLLVVAMLVPPAVGALRARRRRGLGLHVRWVRCCERVRSVKVGRRTARVADAAAASGTLSTVAPPTLTRADVRRAEQQRRAAERQERLQAERRRLREEAQRAAAAAWDQRMRAMRERAEADARARAEAIDNARRIRAERAEALVAERRDAEERRLERVRANEARRREETAERARRRAAESIARRRLGREADAAMRKDVIAEELHRQHQTELSRAAVVQLRSEEARELARSWIVRSRSETGSAPPPLPGEHHAIDALLVTLPDPDARRAVRFAAAPPPETPEPDLEAAGSADGAPHEAGRSRARERIAVVALDVDALNARLQRKSR
jgi:hypothetical protein